MSRIAAALLLCICVAPRASATDHKRKDRDVLIDNRKRVITIYDNPADSTFDPTRPAEPGGRRRALLRPTQTITVQPNEVVSVGIERQNPLIFVYTFRGVVTAPTADFTAAATFAGSLTKLIGMAPMKAFATAANARIARAPQGERAALTEKLSKVRELLAAVGFTDETVLSLATLRDALIRQVEAIPSLRKQTLDDALLEGAQSSVRGWEVDQQSKQVDALFTIVTNARNALLKALIDDPTLFDSDPGLVTTVNMFGSEESNVRRLLTAAKEFADRMAVVGTPLRLGDPIPFDAANTSTATVAIEYAAGAQDIVKNAGLPLQPMIGEFAVTFEPYSRLTLGGGPSVLYVFRKNAEGKNIGWRPVGMLTVGSRLASEGLIAPHLELGVTPETDKIGLYLGVGLRVRGAFNLSAGLTAQQEKLEKGSNWRPSGYLGVTVDLAPKK